MKRTGLVLSAALLTLLTAQATMAKVVTIQYWGVWPEPYKSYELGIVDKFNKLHQGKIKVKAVEIPVLETEEKVLTAVAGGAGPDVFKLDRFRVGSFASKDVLVELDPFIKKDKVDPNIFFKATWKEGLYGGKVYGMPWSTDDRAMLYNKTLFKQAGLDPDRPPRTWDEMNLAAKKIDYKQGEKWSRVGFVPHFGNFYFLGWLFAAGGDMTDDSGKKVTWNSPQGLKAYQFMSDTIQKYGGEAAISNFRDFMTGKLGASMEGSWYFGETLRRQKKNFEYGVAFPPRPAGLEKDPVTWAGGYCISIPRGTKHAKEAWEFVKFYTMVKENQVDLGVRSGQIPALKTAAYDEKFLNSDPSMRRLVELMPEARFRNVLPAGGELYDIYKDELNSFLVSGKKSPQQALDYTASEAQKILDRAWARVRKK